MTNQIQKNFQEEFLDELLDSAGFSDDDNLELLKEDLRPLLQQRIMGSIYKELNQEQRDDVTDLLDNNKINELDEYLRNTISAYDEFLMEIYSNFEDEYLENMA
ncbi:hypothetical protein K9M48_02110 [Candidatus Gracilibacteria bacterium]|nr:hypothetical protein [Candidatus Gracilibacteria bacterium]